MDSRLAADPIARHILELLATMENAAGVRAHYRILDAPPLMTVDTNSVQTLARVMCDWIGLRNALVNISVIPGDQSPKLIRIDPDQEEFVLEVSQASMASKDTALAAITRQVSRIYLINSNIAGSSQSPGRTAGSLVDVTAIFLGMGKLLLNGPAAGQIHHENEAQMPTESRPLAMPYLAFCHRLVCAMRGLDWTQHAAELNSHAVTELKKWDSYRDSVFSQALRNVLTAAASHRPLQDAIEDNQLALSRFDQLQRTFTETVILPLQEEMGRYHATCKDGTERLGRREQDTYDPCLVYLNQLRRRMDLQRYADELLEQQQHIINRLRILTSGLTDLAARNLVQTQNSSGLMHTTYCPFDQTPISIDEVSHDTRVRCPKCSYTFIAISGLPQIAALKSTSAQMIIPGSTAAITQTQNATSNDNAKDNSELKVMAKKQRRALPWLICGFALLALGWVPMIAYVLTTTFQGQDAPLTSTLGKLGMGCSVLGIVLIFIGLIMALFRMGTKKNAPVENIHNSKDTSAKG